MVLRFPSCSPRRPGFFVSVIGAMRQHCRQLDLSVGTSGPHDFTVREASTVRRSAASRPSHPAPNVRDDRETPLLIGCETRRELPVICPTPQAEYFFANEWTVDSALIGLKKPVFWRSGLAGRAKARTEAFPRSFRGDAKQRTRDIVSHQCAEEWIPPWSQQRKREGDNVTNTAGPLIQRNQPRRGPGK